MDVWLAQYLRLKLEARNIFFPPVNSAELEAWERRKCATDDQRNYHHF
jgi:hypothetical protein